MAWRRYPSSFFRDIEEMRELLDSMFQTASETRDMLLLPGGVTDRMMPAIRGEFRVDVREHEDEVLVVADLPGVEKEDVTVTLINPRAFEISCERKSEKEEKEEGYFVRERLYGTMRRVVTLPAEVTDEDAAASFRNGVLEVRLKKLKAQKKGKISIE
jgi:HSP20 family protein